MKLSDYEMAGKQPHIFNTHYYLVVDGNFANLLVNTIKASNSSNVIMLIVLQALKLIAGIQR